MGACAVTRGARRFVAAALLALGAGCAALPDTAALIARHQQQEARFENARGAVSARRAAALVAGLKRESGDIDILERQIALEQAITGTALVLGNKVTLLEDGAATYAAMFAAIRGARDHVNLETYIIEDDEIGRAFADLLLERQAAGVQVNLVYDSFGSYSTPRAFFRRLTDAGIAVLEFNPLNPASAREHWQLNNRDHRKLLIVDGGTAFLGGINISSVYSSGSMARRAAPDKQADEAWRDTDLRIEGPVVAEFQKLFLATWEKQHGPALAPRAYLPALAARGSDIVRAIGSSADDPYSLFYLTLISAIGNAEREVFLTQAYFVPDDQLLGALTAAAGRGVDVRLILPGKTDSGSTYHAGRSHYAALLKSGVKVYERRGALLHAKTALVDGVWTSVGSSNLDWRSSLDNDEIEAVVLGREFGGVMRAMFERDLAASQMFDLAAWEQRPLSMRFKEWLARLIGRLL